MCFFLAGEQAVSLKKERTSGLWQVLQRQHGDLFLGKKLAASLGDNPNPWLLAKIRKTRPSTSGLG